MKYFRAQRRSLRFLPLLLFFILPMVLLGMEGGAKVLPELHLGNAPLRAVFRSLAEFGEFQIILGPFVQGKVTLPLKAGMSARESVELLAEMHGYSCHWVEGAALIGADPATLGQRTSGHYQWTAANDDVVVAALTRVVPRDRLQVQAGQKEVHIMANALEDENIRELLAEVDRTVTPYVIEAELVEVELSYAQEHGLSWALPGTSAHASLRLIALPETIDRQRSAPGIRRLAGVRVWADQNRPGVVFLGDQYPVITSEPNTQVDLVQYQKVGVGIEVTPHVVEGGTGLDLTLTVSGIGGWIQTADGRNIPQMKNNQILAKQTLAPGETCVLSGLTFTGQDASALILDPGQEGPAKERTVCLFLTPQPGGNVSAGTEGTAPTVAPPQTAGAEVIHIEIFSTDQPKAVAATPPATQVLTEVVGLGETKTPGGEASGPTEVQLGETLMPGEPIQEQRVGEQSVEEVPPAALRVAYRVVKGDTVFSIGRKYGVDPSAILQENAIPSSGFLQVGQTIRIPIPPTHLYQLQPKETLWRIAQRYGTTVELLMEINSITDVTTLRTDQMIILPVPTDQVIKDNY